MDSKEVSARVAAHAHGRVPRELRRTQVLALAYELFVERGYQGASMDELAQRVGVTKPVIYGLCGSKEQLFREVMASVQADLAAAVADAVADKDDLDERLRAGILAFLRFVHQRRQGWMALLSMESGLGSSSVIAIRKDQVSLIAGLIAEEPRTRHDRRTLEALAQAISGAVEFAALWWADHPALSAEQLAKLLSDLLSPGLHALVSARRPRRARK